MSTFDWPPEVNGAPWDAVENPFTDHPEATDGPYRVMSAVPNALVEQLTAGTGTPGRMMVDGVAFSAALTNIDTFIGTATALPEGEVWFAFNGADIGIVYRGNWVSGPNVVPTLISAGPAHGTVFYTEFYVGPEDTLQSPRLFTIGADGPGQPSETVLGQTVRLISADATVYEGDVVYLDATAGDIDITISAAPTAGLKGIMWQRIDETANTVHFDCTYLFNPAGFDAETFGWIFNSGPSWLPMHVPPGDF